MTERVLPKIFKFGELSYKAGRVRVRITDIKWGKIKDINGAEFDFQRGDGKRIKITKNLSICSQSSPELSRGDNGTYILFVWGSNDEYDHESAYYDTDNINLYKAFLDLQQMAIEEDSEEVSEPEVEPEVSEIVDIEESTNPNF